MRSRVFHGVACSIVLLLAAANVWVYRHRHEGYLYSSGSYAQVYYTDAVPTIAGFDAMKDGSLRVDARGISATSWRVTSDATGETRLVEGNSPIIPAPTKPTRYTIQAVDASQPAIELTMDLSRGGADSNAKMYKGRVLDSSVPIGSPDRQMSQSDFMPRVEWFEPAEVEAARRVLEEAGIRSDQSAERRMRAIFVHLMGRLDGHRGSPSPAMTNVSGWRQYELASAGGEKIYCANFAAIFHFFCNVAGVPTRRVSLWGRSGDVLVSAHEVIEVFLQEELQWVCVDPFGSKLFVRAEKSGRKLNTLDIVHAMTAGTEDALSAEMWRDGQMVAVPFASNSEMERQHYNRNVTVVFQLAREHRNGAMASALRYTIRPDLAYRMEGFGAKPYLKFVAVWGMLGAMVAWPLAGLWLRSSDKRLAGTFDAKRDDQG